MSSLSNLPYGMILDYWYEKLKGNPHLIKFLVTKSIEAYTFKSNSENVGNKQNYFDFPDPVTNSVPENPKISVVVPAYIKSEKDCNDILNLIKSIERQKLVPYKVIIVDDCSPCKFDFPKWIHACYLEKNSGPAKARNHGKKVALDNDSDIIAFTDVDCILCENWLMKIASSFIENRRFNILSGDTPSFDDSWLGLYHDINGTLNGRKIVNTNRLLYGTTANLAITRDVAAQIHFNESFPIAAGEDIEFCFRANWSKFAIKHEPAMTVFHNYGYTRNIINDIKRFRQQFKKYGQGEKVLLSIIPNYYAYFDKTIEIQTKNSPLTNGEADSAVVS